MLYVALNITLLSFFQSRLLFKRRRTFYCCHVTLRLRLSKLLQVLESVHISVVHYPIACAVMYECTLFLSVQ